MLISWTESQEESLLRLYGINLKESQESLMFWILNKFERISRVPDVFDLE